MQWHIHKVLPYFQSADVVLWGELLLLLAVFCQDELLAELDELEQEELDKNLLDIGPENVPLPNVPSTSLPSRPGGAFLAGAFLLPFCRPGMKLLGIHCSAKMCHWKFMTCFPHIMDSIDQMTSLTYSRSMYRFDCFSQVLRKIPFKSMQW